MAKMEKKALSAPEEKRSFDKGELDSSKLEQSFPIKHAAKNVAASMFWLERRHPNEFALKTVNRDSRDTEQLAPCDKISLE